MFLEHITQAGERWDTLAYRYYGDAAGYPRLIAANPHIPITPLLPSGIVLLVPVIEVEERESADEVPPWLR